jgi:hypothetical protein
VGHERHASTTRYAPPPSPVTPLRCRGPRTRCHGCGVDLKGRLPRARPPGTGKTRGATGKNRRVTGKTHRVTGQYPPATGRTATARSEGHDGQRARALHVALHRDAPRHAHHRTPCTLRRLAANRRTRSRDLVEGQGASTQFRPAPSTGRARLRVQAGTEKAGPSVRRHSRWLAAPIQSGAVVNAQVRAVKVGGSRSPQHASEARSHMTTCSREPSGTPLR